MSQIRVMGGGVKLIETMSQNMQFFFWMASLRSADDFPTSSCDWLKQKLEKWFDLINN